jgi:CubicO group peptidase (beta-lactamase class C family)
VCAVLNGTGLERETLGEMLTPQIDVDKDLGLTWTLGFGLQTDSNGPAFWQWGDYGIFRNYIIAYPKQKLAVVYLTNSFLGLGICHELIAGPIGGQALGMTFLNYRQYDPTSPGAHLGLARAWLERGDREQARRDYDKVMALAKDKEDFDTAPMAVLRKSSDCTKAASRTSRSEPSKHTVV